MVEQPRLGVYDIWAIASEHEFPRRKFHESLGRVVESFLRSDVRRKRFNPERDFAHDASAGSGQDAQFLRERLPGLEVHASDGSIHASFADFNRRGRPAELGEAIEHVPWSFLPGHLKPNFPKMLFWIGPSAAYANAWHPKKSQDFDLEGREMQLNAAIVGMHDSLPRGGRIIADAHALETVLGLNQRPEKTSYWVDLPERLGGGRAKFTETVRHVPDPADPRRGMHEWKVTVQRGSNRQVQTLRSLILDHHRLMELFRHAGFVNVRDISSRFPGYPYAVITAQAPGPQAQRERQFMASQRRKTRRD